MFLPRFPFAPQPVNRPAPTAQREDCRTRRWKSHGGLARAVVGTVGTTSILCAGAFVFGPFSDLSTLQLAAGPHATDAAASAPAAIVLSQTGRAWGAAALQRQTAAASAPLARVARHEEPGVP